jgi:hypothetical protein
MRRALGRSVAGLLLGLGLSVTGLAPAGAQTAIGTAGRAWWTG